MPLKIKIKPGERVLIGTALILNGENPAQISVMNQVPILREKDLLSQADADSHARKLYFVVQMMYIEQRRTKEQYDSFLALTKELLQAAPSLIDTIYKISEHVLDGSYYNALKEARLLIRQEGDLIGRATGNHS